MSTDPSPDLKDGGSSISCFRQPWMLSCKSRASHSLPADHSSKAHTLL